MFDFIQEYWAQRRFKRNIRRWFRADGDRTYRLDYPLNPGSVVFDVGGYHGDFAARIHERYRCNVWVFEPVRSFQQGLEDRFRQNPAVTLCPFGLGGQSRLLPMTLAEDGSSCFGTKSDPSETVEIRRFTDFIHTTKVPFIDLMKINIEGGEFELLDHLIEEEWIPRIANLQVQFHRFIPHAAARRRAVRRHLRRTHRLTYDFYFVWENWRLREAKAE